MPKITYNDQNFEVEKGQTLLHALIEHGVDLPHDCEQGSCGIDAVVVIRGIENLSPPFGDEADYLNYTHFPENVRLACCSRVFGDVEIILYQ